MKTSQKILFVVALTIPLSCAIYLTVSIFNIVTYHRHYEFEIVNRTPYQLDSIYVTTATDRNFSLAPNGTSDQFAFDLGPFGDFFAEARVGIVVRQFATADSIYKNRIGRSLAFRMLKEDEVNRIVIIENPYKKENPDTHFDAIIEHPYYVQVTSVKK